MVEYNWWDDRTVEENDNYYCPVICGCCFDGDCETCKDHLEFVKEVEDKNAKGFNAKKSC